MNYKVIENISEIGEFLSELATVTEIALDIETSSLDPQTCKLYSLQVGTRNTIYIFNLLKFKEINYITSLLSDKVCIGHNIKYDMEVLYTNTKILLTKVYDTMLAELLTLREPPNVRLISLSDLVQKYCGVTLDKTVRESFYKNGELTELSEQQLIYMAEDVKYLFNIKDIQEKEIDVSRQREVWELECKIEPIVCMMELTGISLDTEAWTKLTEKARQESIEIRKNTIELLIDRKSTRLNSSHIR
jgi:DNA polymerase-1